MVKNPPTSAGDMGLIPGSGRSLGEGDDNPLQYSCLGNPMDRGAWQCSPWHPKRAGQDLAANQQQQGLWPQTPPPIQGKPT